MGCVYYLLTLEMIVDKYYEMKKYGMYSLLIWRQHMIE